MGSVARNNLCWLNLGIKKKAMGKTLFDIQMVWNCFSSEDRKERESEKVMGYGYEQVFIPILP